MDKVIEYSAILKQVIQEYYALYSKMADAQTILIIEPAAHQYQVIQVGWDLYARRIYTSIHLSIHNNKVYIHSDPTEEGIANVLVSKGIPTSNIVLEYQAPSFRQHTAFATT